MEMDVKTIQSMQPREPHPQVRRFASALVSQSSNARKSLLRSTVGRMRPDRDVTLLGTIERFIVTSARLAPLAADPRNPFLVRHSV
jgi:hypothetical protein